MKKDTIPKIGRPSKRLSTESDKYTPKPQTDVRFDCVAHWPEYRAMERKCRHSKTGQSRDIA